MSDKLLIIGAFPKKKNKVYGGVLKSCEILMNSSFANEFNIITLDTTQKSNPPPSLIIRFFYSISRTISLLKTLINKQPKVTLIFTSDGFSAFEKGVNILICNFFGSKTLIFPRAGNLINQVSNSSFFLKIIKYLFNKADIFLCQGYKWKYFASNKLNIVDDKIEIVGNWTATQSLINVGKNKKYIKNKNKINFVFIGWIENHKGIFELLNASNILLKKKYEFNLTFVGGGNEEKSAERFTKKHKMNDSVNFAGWKNSKQLTEIFELNDVFVLPSWNEGMPNSMIEAMAAGLAVIVTSVGVITDYLNNNQQAVIVPPKDIEALKNAMIKIINDENFRIKLSKNGHKFAKNHFSANKELSNLKNIINKLLKKSYEK